MRSPPTRLKAQPEFIQDEETCTDASCLYKTGGFDLWLSRCKAVIEAHHGRIEITGQVGQGNRATVLLPVDKS